MASNRGIRGEGIVAMEPKGAPRDAPPQDAPARVSRGVGEDVVVKIVTGGSP